MELTREKDEVTEAEKNSNALYYSFSFGASHEDHIKSYWFCTQYFSDVGAKKGW